jgi:hypothetical protein
VVAGAGPVKGLHQVVHEVEAAGDLRSLPRTGPGALGVRTAPVARDDLDAGMRAQPRGERRRLAVGQQVDDAMAL